MQVPLIATICVLVAAQCLGTLARRLGEGATFVDLSPMLQEVQESDELVAIAAFVSSTDGVCAAGSVGDLAISMPDTPASLWNSSWHAGSLTKSMTASLTALLVADESVPLQWDTTLAQVLPVEAGKYANVTIEQLLSHRGGFQREVEPTDEEYWSSFPSLSLFDQRRFIMLYGLATEPAVKPIEEGLYSNLGYVVAGALLENVTGIVWEDLITDHLFSKLEMSSAYFGCPDSPSSPLGHYYDPEMGFFPTPAMPWCDCIANIEECYCDNPPVAGPAGTVHMQLSDFVRYYQWHLAGELGEDTSMLLSQDEFHRLHTSLGEIKSGFGNETFEAEYGFGWVTTDSWYGIDRDVLAHDGSNDRWLSNVVMSLEDRRVYFVVTNSVRTKSGEPISGFHTILSNMTSSLYNESACVPVGTVDSGRVAQSHDECPESVYGSSEPDKTTSGAWKESAPFAYILAVLLMKLVL